MARPLGSLHSVELERLNGVGPSKVADLAHFGIHDVFDLVTHYPRRQVDRTKRAVLAEVAVGDEVAAFARVTKIEKRPLRGRRVMVAATIDDGTARMAVTFFNQAWRVKQLPVGTEAIFFGTVDEFRGRKQMTNPLVDLVGNRTGRIIPVYPQSDKVRVTSEEIGEWVAQSLRRAGELEDPVPEHVLDRLDLIDRTAAISGVHFPETMDEYWAARRRLVFDEFLRIQLALVARKRHIERTSAGIPHQPPGALVEAFHARLPYDLTRAQRRAIAEISADMVRPVPMHRLLQGDVGAGKTLVAVSAALVAVAGGHQAALMAPTEVLAEQHAMGIRELVGDFEVGESGALFNRPLRVELLTNRVPAGRRKELTADLAAGRVDLVIGTHALLSEDVGFSSLGLVVIDEQHRFGVEQRAVLREKAAGGVPDVLVMTATPIPRTAAMTVYGDLDVSVLDELPAGRVPIATSWPRTDLDVAAAWERVREQLRAGHQAYVVCPLVEESEKLEAASATEMLEELQAGELAGFRCGLLHGRVDPSDKEATMGAFRAGELDVLVATTVIEVGVDVPNATVMVIVDADRFGIAQLHQLRGRVGRGRAASWCYLLGDGSTPDGQARLEAMVRTTDGFELAKVDLELRGEGAIMGARQKGRSDLKLASFRKDRDVLEAAREVAFELVDAGLTPALQTELASFLDDEDQEFLTRG